MSVSLILQVEGTSPTATQLNLLKAYAEQLFNGNVKVGIAVPTEQGKQEESTDEPARSSNAPYWDDEIKGWIDPVTGNWLVNFG